MKKLMIALLTAVSVSSAVYATQLPQELKTYVEKSFPKTDFRFDGVIILPDNTIYIPLIPAKFDTEKSFTVKSTIPSAKSFSQKPDAIIFDNDYVLLRVITDANGKKSLVKLQNPQIELRTGLLPQDMLVPKNLSIPGNLKNIIGNLEISTAKEPTLAVPVVQPKTVQGNSIASLKLIPELKGKTLYVSTSFSKSERTVLPGFSICICFLCSAASIATLSPGLTDVTPSPTYSTIPEEQYPGILGNTTLAMLLADTFGPPIIFALSVPQLTVEN